MKKYILIFFATFSTTFAFAQQSIIKEKPFKYYSEGLEMYNSKNYVGATHSLTQFTKTSKDELLNQDAEFYIIASKFYLGDEDWEFFFKNYLDTYPSTSYRSQIYYMLGSGYFINGNWREAKNWFSDLNPELLPLQDQEDFYFRNGYCYLQEKNYPVATQLFNKVLRTQKYNAPASFYLGYIDLENKNYNRAQTIFEALKNDAEYGTKSQIFLSQIAFVNGDYNKSINLSQNILRNNSKLSDADKCELYRIIASSSYNTGNDRSAFENYQLMEQYYNKAGLNNEVSVLPLDFYRLGELYYKNANFNEAISCLTKSASDKNEIGQASNMLLGQCYLKTNDPAKALMYFDLASRADYDKAISEEALYNYVMLSNQTVDVYGQSVSAFKRFLTLYPDSKYKTQVYNQLNNIFLSSNDYETALKEIESLPNKPNNILATKQAILYQQGVQSFLDKNYPNSITKFNTVIDMGNYNPTVKNDATFWRAEALFQENNFALASNDFSTFIKESSPSSPNYSTALYNMGYSYFKNKEYNKAMDGFSKYVNLQKDTKSPIYADALNRLGDCYLFNRNYSEAEKYYTQAASLSPEIADYALFQKSFALGLQKNYRAKISTLDEMMQKFPNSSYSANALFEKSRAYIMLNDENQAISSLQKLEKEYPNSNIMPKAEVQLGQLYFNNNNNKKSIESYKNVMTKYPNSEEALIAMNSLEAVYKDMNDVNSYVSFVNSMGGKHTISATRQDTLNFQVAENLYIKGEKNLALQAMESYTKDFPNGKFTSDADFYVGSIFMEQGKNNEALPYFKSVIASNNPKFIDDALIYASGIEYDKEDYSSAYNLYKQLSLRTSNSKNKNIANLGMLRSSYLMHNNSNVISVANEMLKEKNLSSDVETEARYYRAKSLMQENKLDLAFNDFKFVSKNMRSIEGAESKYMMAKILFMKHDYKTSIREINDFMASGTPQKDWIAKSIILLSDDYVAIGEKDQALQYLESLRANYNGDNAEILSDISSRIDSLRPSNN